MVKNITSYSSIRGGTRSSETTPRRKYLGSAGEKQGPAGASFSHQQARLRRHVRLTRVFIETFATDPTRPPVYCVRTTACSLTQRSRFQSFLVSLTDVPDLYKRAQMGF